MFDSRVTVAWLLLAAVAWWSCAGCAPAVPAEGASEPPHRAGRSELAREGEAEPKDAVGETPPRAEPEEEEAAEDESEGEDTRGPWQGSPIGARVADPVTTIMLFMLRYEWTSGFHSMEDAYPDAVRDDAQGLTFRGTIPFDLFATRNVLRLTVPYAISTPSDLNGVGGTSILHLMIHQNPRERWKVGAGSFVVLDPLHPDTGIAFQLGPAFGFGMVVDQWVVGLLTESFLGEGVAVTLIRPFLAYTPIRYVTLTLPEMYFRFDWRELDWRGLPLGLQVNFNAPFERNPIVFGLSAHYDFASHPGTPEWIVSGTLILTVPSTQVFGPL